MPNEVPSTMAMPEISQVNENTLPLMNKKITLLILVLLISLSAITFTYFYISNKSTQDTKNISKDILSTTYPVNFFAGIVENIDGNMLKYQQLS